MRLRREPDTGSGRLLGGRLFRSVASALFVALLPVTSPAVGFGGGFGVGESAIDRAIGRGVIGPAEREVEAAGQGGWTLTSGVALSATYSDNADLTSRSDEGQEELFLQVLPYVALEGEGARVSARGYFAPAIYTGTIGGSPARIAPFLDLRGTAELVPETFFLTGFAKASMYNQSASSIGSGLGSTDYLYNSDDISPAFTLQVSPFVRHHLGTTADFLASLSIGTTAFADSSNNNSLNASVWAGFNSGPDFQRIPWTVYYSLRGLRFNDDPSADGSSNTYQELKGRASYVISPVWRIDSSLGYANYDFSSTSDNKSGPTWSLGGTWTPSSRLALSLGYGGEPYGNSWYLSYRYRHRRVGWFARYFTGLTTVQEEFATSETFVRTGPDGLPLIDPATGLPLLTTGVDPTLTNESYVLSRFSTGINWRGNRTSMLLDANWSERDYQVTGDAQKDWGIGARLTRTLSENMSATARFGWTKYENDFGGSASSTATDLPEEEDGWNAGLLLTKQLSQRSSVSGIYDYRSNLSARGFGSTAANGASGDENRVTLVFNHSF